MNGVQSALFFLNRPVVKQGIKNVVGGLTCSFACYEFFLSPKSLEIREPKWVQGARKVSTFTGKISLIMSAAVSSPGVYAISRLSGLFFTKEQFSTVFGPNTIFEIYPWHPRHLASFAALILAFPSVAFTSGEGIYWLYRKVKHIPINSTDHKVQFMVLFNTVTSRPLLHIGNQLLRRLK